MQSSRGPNRRGGPGRSGAPRPGARPGSRSTVRQRSAAGTRSPSSRTEEPVPASSSDAAAAPGERRRAGLTTRAIALAVVLLILTISYASSLRVYINQRQDIAATRQQIITSQQNIDHLSDEISRWNNPDYVRTQARIRLGWVMPGETGFRVIDANGDPVTGGAEIASESTESGPQEAWYQKLWGSVRTADEPAAEKNEDDQPVTEKSQPR